MSNSKGKNRATGNEDDKQGTSETPAETSFLSRVAASASGLTRSAFASPTRNEMDEHAAATLSNAGKGQSSSGIRGGSSWAESSKSIQSSSHPQASGSSGVRVEQTEAHVRQSENEFSDFLDSINSFTPSQDVGQAPVAEMTDGYESVWTGKQITPRLRNGGSAARTIMEQERQDGQDVLSILSGPILDEQFVPPEEEDENYDWGLSQDQMIELRAMTKDLFPMTDENPHVGVSVENLLNLIPLSDEYDKQQWFDQWDGVLNRYADEVWGGLLPLVKEARKEIEDIRNSEEATKQPKALRRLNAILGHLQRR